MNINLFHTLEGKNICFKALSTNDAQEYTIMHQMRRFHVLLAGN